MTADEDNERSRRDRSALHVAAYCFGMMPCRLVRQPTLESESGPTLFRRAVRRDGGISSGSAFEGRVPSCHFRPRLWFSGPVLPLCELAWPSPPRSLGSVPCFTQGPMYLRLLPSLARSSPTSSRRFQKRKATTEDDDEDEGVEHVPLLSMTTEEKPQETRFVDYKDGESLGAATSGAPDEKGSNGYAASEAGLDHVAGLRAQERRLLRKLDVVIIPLTAGLYVSGSASMDVTCVKADKGWRSSLRTCERASNSPRAMRTS